jgi:hypothetical protein
VSTRPNLPLPLLYLAGQSSSPACAHGVRGHLRRAVTAAVAAKDEAAGVQLLLTPAGVGRGRHGGHEQEALALVVDGDLERRRPGATASPAPQRTTTMCRLRRGWSRLAIPCLRPRGHPCLRPPGARAPLVGRGPREDWKREAGNCLLGHPPRPCRDGQEMLSHRRIYSRSTASNCSKTASRTLVEAEAEEEGGHEGGEGCWFG